MTPIESEAMHERIAPALIWFREDLRSDDNAALIAAASAGPVVGLYVLEDSIEGQRKPGAASLWWLNKSLQSLKDQLASAGVALILRRGDPRLIVPEVARQAGAGSVHWNRRYLPWSKPFDAAVKQTLTEAGIKASSYRGNVLVEPMEPKTGAGGPYKVYTPFFRAVRETCDQRAGLSAPAPAMTGWSGASGLATDSLADWRLHPAAPDWSGGMGASWKPGEPGAAALGHTFFETVLKGYSEQRNLPGLRSTSKMSPHVHFGEISVARLWTAAAEAGSANPALKDDVEVFHKELVWREFAIHLLHHWPDLAEANWKSDFDRFDWADEPAHLKAWRHGLTGYPIVDAGMRELWHTGWMHNRVRMIVASFLVKHLLIDWRHGEAWFWDTLVDADHASNSASWQWVAGSGADAAPYFRVFNPVSQGEKFDPDARYVRRWVPELARLSDKFIHQPWTAPKELLSQAGVKLGTNYPHPIVDHARARARALETYARLKTA
jgi:deoxyribodipyrimidine photo-lyase